MNYNDLALLAFGTGGILLHNLTKINELKKQGKFAAINYFGMEWAAILISLIIVVLGIIGKKEVAQLEQAGKWLGFAFVFMGYMGQSLLVKYMGKANKVLGGDDTDVQK